MVLEGFKNFSSKSIYPLIPFSPSPLATYGNSPLKVTIFAFIFFLVGMISKKVNYRNNGIKFVFCAKMMRTFRIKQVLNSIQF